MKFSNNSQILLAGVLAVFLVSGLGISEALADDADPNPADYPATPASGPASPSMVPTTDDIFVSSGSTNPTTNGLYKIPAGPGVAQLVTNLPQGDNEDVCYDPVSDTFVVVSDTAGTPLYRVDINPVIPTVNFIANIGAADEIACLETQQTVPGFSDIVGTSGTDVNVFDGNGNPVGGSLLNSAQLVGGIPVAFIEAVGIDLFGTTTCGAGTIYVGTGSGVIALVGPAFTPVRLTSPAGQQFELAVDSVGNSPFDLASASFGNNIEGFTINTCSVAGATNALTVISPQFSTGDDFCFDNLGNIILPNVVGGTVDQIGTGNPNPLGNRIILAPVGAIPSPLGCDVVLQNPNVGGESLPIDMTSLAIGGAAANAIWILPALAGIAGTAFSVLYISTRKN